MPPSLDGAKAKGPSEQPSEQAPGEMSPPRREYKRLHEIEQEPAVDAGPSQTVQSPSRQSQGSANQVVTDAARKILSILLLPLILLWYLVAAIGFFISLCRLGLYAFVLSPAFCKIWRYYYSSKNIKRNEKYGSHPRHRFDLYRLGRQERQLRQLRPVVIFITGGAWIIGHQAWGTLLSMQLVERDIVVICIDYRNYPQAGVGEMVEDVSKGIGHVLNNLDELGGDPDKVYLVGQSAGAHLGACALLMQAKHQVKENTTGDGASVDPSTFSVSKIKAYFALSGGYNLESLADHFKKNLLYRSMFLRIMGDKESLQKYSPLYMVKDPWFRDAVGRLSLPKIFLFHGKADYSIPSSASLEFEKALRDAKADVEIHLYDDKTHTDLFLQDPMRGGKNDLLAEILNVIYPIDLEAQDADSVMDLPRLVPEWRLRFARWVSPF